MKYLNLILAIFLTSLIGGCSDNEYVEYYEEEVIEALYWHNKDNYSVAIKSNDNTLKIKPVFKRMGRLSLFVDVKNNEPMWYFCEYKKSTSFWTEPKYKDSICEIHIRDVKDINTAEVKNGKFKPTPPAKIIIN